MSTIVLHAKKSMIAIADVPIQTARIEHVLAGSGTRLEEVPSARNSDTQAAVLILETAASQCIPEGAWLGNIHPRSAVIKIENLPVKRIGRRNRPESRIYLREGCGFKLRAGNLSRDILRVQDA